MLGILYSHYIYIYIYNNNIIYYILCSHCNKIRTSAIPAFHIMHLYKHGEHVTSRMGHNV